MTAQIMVINDTEEILELFRMLLEEEGYAVTLFSYAPKELDMLERHNPDLVILDLMFGTENLGWQLLEKMKLRRSTAAIPVIICTAATREVREIEGHLKSQGVVVVAKPFDIDTLLNAVQSMLTIANRSAGIQDAQAAQDAPDAEQKGARPNRKIS